MEEKIRCWDCKFLGTCKKASGKIEKCSLFVNYKLDYSRFLSKKQIAKFLNVDERTIFRHFEKMRNVLENLENITGKEWCYKKSDYDKNYYVVEVKKNE